jgi:hypothetical protein
MLRQAGPHPVYVASPGDRTHCRLEERIVGRLQGQPADYPSRTRGAHGSAHTWAHTSGANAHKTPTSRERPHGLATDAGRFAG